MDNRCLISIVVPIYNVEKYLEQCLDSIVNQTYTNLEIILLNDGSKDSSGDICNRYAEKDSRVSVVHKDNEGVSKTRNKGIELSHGDYVMFVDSDDWLDLDMCEQLMNAITLYNVDMAMCTYVREYPEKSIPKLLHSDDVVFSGIEFRRKLCGPMGKELNKPENMDSYNSTWGKLYPVSSAKKHFFTDLKEIGVAEDLLYNIEFAADINNVVYINQPMYHYRKNVVTSITAVYKPKLGEQLERLYSKISETIASEKMSDDFNAALNNRIAINTLGLGINCVQDNAGVIEKCRRIKNVLSNQERRKALKQLSLKTMPLHWSFFYLCAKLRLVFPLCLMLIIIERLKGKI